MTVENHFQLLPIALTDADPWCRQESKPPGDVQPKYSFLRSRDGESCEFARHCRRFPLVAFDIEPRDQSTAMENTAIPYLDFLKKDQ